MPATSKPLFAQTAADLMNPDVVLLSPEMPLRDAAELLATARIRGAPVVNERGRCIGVLSTTDLLHWAEDRDPGSGPFGTYVCEWEVAKRRARPEDRVRGYMTTDPVTATTEAGIAQLARMMIDAGIHRVIVVDEERRPIGVVSSSDVLAAVAYENPA
jgi:CBS-domain-containing membrane protein